MSMIDGHMRVGPCKDVTPPHTGTLPAPRTRHGRYGTLSRYCEINDASGTYNLMWRSFGEGDFELTSPKSIYPQMNLVNLIQPKPAPPLPPPCPPSSLCLPPNLARRGRFGMSPPKATVSDIGHRGDHGSPLHPSAWKPGGQAICTLPRDLTPPFSTKRVSLSPPGRENVQVDAPFS